MDIKTIGFSYRNDNGHKVYDFYPDRNFDDEIIFCPWIGEVKHHHMLAAVFAICDKANIKVSVLALEDHIPLFSFYSHSLICVSEDTVRLNSGTRRESEEKLRYFDKHSTDCYNKLYFEKRAIENDNVTGQNYHRAQIKFRNEQILGIEAEKQNLLKSEYDVDGKITNLGGKSNIIGES